MHIQEHVDLKRYTTLHIGGEAEYFVLVTTEAELQEAVRWAQKKGCMWRIIGGGSNILFGDGVIRGLTICNRISGMRIEERDPEVFITVGAGVLFDEVVSYACAQGWWGLENLSHIPGTVGATPIQNVGAYGVEIAQRLVSVRVYDSMQDSYRTLSTEECKLQYRHSLFKEEEGKHFCITQLTLAVSKEGAPHIAYRDLAHYFAQRTEPTVSQEVREAVIAIRSKKFPDWHVYGTAGSFFKNPTISTEQFDVLCTRYPGLVGYPTTTGEVKVALGWILEHVCHIKGMREGAVGAYDAQALVLVNYGNATAQELITFAQKIISEVREKTHITIEYEVTYIA